MRREWLRVKIHPWEVVRVAGRNIQVIEEPATCGVINLVIGSMNERGFKVSTTYINLVKFNNKVAPFEVEHDNAERVCPWLSASAAQHALLTVFPTACGPSMD
ncbi:hypothetical protein DM860_009244 [Cuscuta australis]|uniref:Uncharacterized protein n=1 Tax=Cuscuta australis TaxID=267555 RepID=A0A328DAA4_9ASTE|nr:hypothetical protein DM860_009244 [Cuscuta australis]